MFTLTPAERRGLIMLVLLFVIGAGWDLVQARRVRDRARPGADRSPVPALPNLEAPAEGELDFAGRSGGASSSPVRASVPAPAPVDLNRASAAELDELPGIGPVLAARIVDHRRTHGSFRRVDELLAVPGIGPKLLERLRSFVVAKN